MAALSHVILKVTHSSSYVILVAIQSPDSLIHFASAIDQPMPVPTHARMPAPRDAPHVPLVLGCRQPNSSGTPCAAATPVPRDNIVKGKT